MSMIQRNQQINWENFINTAKGVTIMYLNDWIVNAYIRVGTVNGTTAKVPAGGLESRTALDFSVSLRSALAQIPGVSPQVTDEFAKQVWRTWKQWYQELVLFIPTAFPMFAAYPGPYAPLQPGVANFPFILAFAPFTKNKKLNPILKQKLIKIAQDFAQAANTPNYHANPYAFNGKNGAVDNWKSSGIAQTTYQGNAGYKASPNVPPPPPTGGLTLLNAMENYADWFEERLDFWKCGAGVVNLFGEGPVPSFNPSISILAGPVSNGRLRGEKVLTARFE